jgi:hypothetical protein
LVIVLSCMYIIVWNVFTNFYVANEPTKQRRVRAGVASHAAEQSHAASYCIATSYLTLLNYSVEMLCLG